MLYILTYKFEFSSKIADLLVTMNEPCVNINNIIKNRLEQSRTEGKAEEGEF